MANFMYHCMYGSAIRISYALVLAIQLCLSSYSCACAEWLTYSVFSDTRLSLLRLTTQQQDLERKLVSLGHDTARQVNEYLQVVSDQAESRLQQTLEIQSDANVNIERRLQRQNATNLAMKKKIMGNSVNIGELQREVQDLRLAYEQKFDSLWRIVNTAGVVEVRILILHCPMKLKINFSKRKYLSCHLEEPKVGNKIVMNPKL